jgi:hypothetical protein
MTSRHVAAKTAALAFIAPLLLAAVSCSSDRLTLTGPSSAIVVTASESGLAASSSRSGTLDVTKECSQFAQGFCTVTASNVKHIEVGTQIIYLDPANVQTSGVGSDVVLELPGPGNNRAFGHCELSATTQRCTFSGGEGKFSHFTADVIVSGSTSNPVLFFWQGVYSFS